MKQLKRVVALCLVLLLGSGLSVSAGDAYSFSRKTEGTVPCPDPFYATGSLTGETLGVGDFNSVQDLFYHRQTNRLYIVDTGNSRVVIYSLDTGETAVVDDFTNTAGQTETFSAPRGIAVNQKGDIALADTGNERLLILDSEWHARLDIRKPESEYLSDEVKFQPSKVVLGDDERIFCIADGINTGMLEFGNDGVFIGFSGANKVIASPLELLWKRISTEAMNKGTVQYVPTEFSNLALDPQGFIYTTTASVNADNVASSYPVRKQSTSGKNILIQQDWYYPIGDIEYPTPSQSAVNGPSTFVDVAVCTDGVYFCLDSKRCRVFTYDTAGNMLFAFGGAGTELGHFGTPTSLTTDDTCLYVADAERNMITIFEPALFGQLVLSAETLHSNGEYQQAEAVWAQVLQLNANYEIGYSGMGKALLCQDRYKEALSCFRTGENRSYYSKAYALYQKEQFSENIGWLCGGLLLAVALAVTVGVVAKRRRGVAKRALPAWVSGLQFSFYSATHPFDGFYDLKHEKRGRMSSALLLCAGLGMTLLIQRQFTGFIFNMAQPEDLNILYIFGGAFLGVFLWSIANWSITTLMSGEGKFSEIFMATSYALLPFCLCTLLGTVLSNLFTLNEQALYTVIMGAGLVWSAFLLFAAMQTTHQYTGLQTVICILLTLISMAIILFLTVLFFNLLSQLFSFVMKIYTEIIFRI